MRFPYDTVDWRFAARILNENSIRLSRTRAGESNTNTSREKQSLRLKGDALSGLAAKNEEDVHKHLFETRQAPPPNNGREVLDLLWKIADLTNAGLLPEDKKLRAWPSPYQPPGPSGNRVDHTELPAALEHFADLVYQRWEELAADPVPLASWAEWELNGGSLHPFYDGCGRISRSFGALLLLRAGWLLPLYEDRETYFAKGHQGPAAFAAYVASRVEACAQWLSLATG